MIFWIIIYGVACFMFGYFLGNRSVKDDKQNTKQEYKITTYSENLEHLLFNKAIPIEHITSMSSDTIELYVIENIANQIKPFIKDKMVMYYDPRRMENIYKFDLWVRRL